MCLFVVFLACYVLALYYSWYFWFRKLLSLYYCSSGYRSVLRYCDEGEPMLYVVCVLLSYVSWYRTCL